MTPHPTPRPTPQPQPTDTDRAMLDRAIELAQQAADIDEVPVGAVVYRIDPQTGKNQILAEAANRREIDQDPTAHAEMIALRQAARTLGSWRLIDCTLAVTLEPCPMCAGALVNARIPKLVYGATDPSMGCVDTLHRLCDDTRFNHRLEIIAGVNADQCGQLLTSFFQQLRRPQN